MPSPRTRRFAYYDRLSADQKRVYRKSDALSTVPLPDAAALRPLVPALRAALEGGERAKVERVAARLVRGLLEMLAVGPVTVEVLEARPRNDYGELHGLYTFEPGEPGEPGDPAQLRGGRPPRIQVWMRTAAKGRVVAWRSFLRTLLHEVGHHLDLHHFHLEETFHTQGFYRRENHLFHQLVDEPPPRPAQLRFAGF